MRVFLRLLTAAAVAACVAVVSNQARGAFPGVNGRIVFVSDRDGNLEIYSMNADGSDQANLSYNPAIDAEPAFSPDGSQIVFRSDRTGNREIYKMSSSGGNLVQLTINSVSDRSPAWTSDGRIVFERGDVGSCAIANDVWIMNADGSGQQNITNRPGAADCAPNGSSVGRVVFSSFRDGNGELYAMNQDGSGLQRMTNNTACDLYANWSPDTGRVLLVRDPDLSCAGTDNDIYVRNVDGSGELRLTNTPTDAEFIPAWSPQGDKIVFDRCTSFPTGPCQIYTMNSGGGGEAPITSIGNNTAPDWQPAPPPPPPPPPPPAPPPPPPPPPPPTPSARCVVPKVVGLKLAAAKGKIRKARCSLGRVTKKKTARSRVGRVIKQSPKAGKRLARGGRVSLVVGRR